MILHHRVIETARKHYGKTAIIDRSLNRKLTYGKTLISALVLQRHFRRIEDRTVGVLLPTTAGGLITMLALSMAGKVPAVINYSTGAEANTRFAMRAAGTGTVITSRQFLAKIECPILPGMICLEDIMAKISLADKLRAAVRSMQPARSIIGALPKVNEDDTVVILFTSGSEMDPKIVPLTHRNLATNIADLNAAYGFGADNIGMAMLPLFHVFGYNANFWYLLTNGMTAVTYANPLDYKMIPRIVREEGVTLIAGTPVFLAGYLRNAKPGDFKTIKLMMSAGDKTPEPLREAYRRDHGIELMDAYGTTETSPGIAVNTPACFRPGSIGKPMASVQVKIVDIFSGEELPAGIEGRILVRGENVTPGYLNDPETNARKFRDGWYDTGDIGTWDEDGFLWHRGRFARFAKIGGEMVSLMRTESVLERVIPEGVDCCVVEVPHSIKGAQLVAALSQKLEDLETIKKHLQEQLPSIALPKLYIVLPELPKMGTGKVDFRALTATVRGIVEQGKEKGLGYI